MESIVFGIETQQTLHRQALFPLKTCMAPIHSICSSKKIKTGMEFTPTSLQLKIGGSITQVKNIHPQTITTSTSLSWLLEALVIFIYSQETAPVL